MSVSIVIMRCSMVQVDQCGDCGAYWCGRRSYLSGTDPCSIGDGVWVQQVTVEAACDNCPTGGGPLPQPSFFTYYEQLLPEAFQGNRMTQCDVFDWPAPACGVGSRGYLKVIGDQRYFCLSDFPGSVNPFAGAPTGPIPAAFATCACIPGWTSGTFPHLLFATPPAWWTNFRAVAVRSSHVSWDCCQAQSPSTCQCLP